MIAEARDFEMDQSFHTAAAEKRFSDSDLAHKWTDMYDSETVVLEESNFRKRRDATVEYVLHVLPRGGCVLDLGCGAAPVLSELRRNGVSCTGLEYSEDMLKHAENRLGSLNLDAGDLHRGDCRSAPFPDESFDVVVCLGVISYVEQYGEVLDEIKRLLKPGGHLIISFRNRFNPIFWDPFMTLKHIAKALIGRLRPPPYEIGRFMDHIEFRHKMNERGFELEKFFGIGYGPIRFRRRDLFSEANAIRISNGVTKIFRSIGWGLPQRWLADVSLWAYRKPSRGANRSSST